ncbi:hypothetical protein GCM10010381_65160 [Streptomyces xantholiticus]|nr:hypothetical protein GCM10010381_65160 [Streptomyces xantholiticus]
MTQEKGTKYAERTPLPLGPTVRALLLALRRAAPEGQGTRTRSRRMVRARTRDRLGNDRQANG